MTFYSVSNPYPQILSLTGTGLNDGDVYFGVAGQDPLTHPKTVYWDLAGTQVADQPIPTTGGYLYRSNSPANVYLNSTYSIKVLDKNGNPVYYQANVFDPVFQIAADLAAYEALLAGPAGAGEIGYNFGTALAVDRTLLQAGHDTMNINAEYEVLGGNDTGDAVKIQNALDGAIIGGNITADPGAYKIVGGSWSQTRYFDWNLTQYATFRGDYVSGDTDNVINIDVATTDGRGDIRLLTFRGGVVFTNAVDSSSDAGGYAIALNSQTGGLPQLGTLIERSLLSGRLGAALFKGDFTTDSVQFSGIHNSNLVNGVNLDGVSDGSHMLFNLSFGENVAYKLNARLGSFNHTIEGGYSVNTMGALQVEDADRWLLHNVQIEQPPTLSTQTQGAHVFIRGLTRASIGGTITNNNFGGGDNVGNLIYLGHTYATFIDQNYLNRCNSAGFLPGTTPGADVLLDPASDNTIIGTKNVPHGPRSRISSLVDGLSTDSSRLLRIQLGDTAIRVRGAWLNGRSDVVSTLFGLYANGWTSTNLEIMMLESGMVVFNGAMVPGTLAAGTVICTFPAWLRPFADKKVMAVCDDGTVHGFNIKANGEFSPLNLLPAGNINLDNTFWMAMTFNPYNPGV